MTIRYDSGPRYTPPWDDPGQGASASHPDTSLEALVRSIVDKELLNFVEDLVDAWTQGTTAISSERDFYTSVFCSAIKSALAKRSEKEA